MGRLRQLQELCLNNRYDTAFLLGGLLTLALPPLGLFPVFFLVIPAQMWLTAHARNARAAFLTGWAFGGGYFILGLYWLGIAFSEMYDDIPWFLPFVVFGIPLYIALHYALASWAAFFFRRNNLAYALATAVFFFWAEYVRGHYPGNFPWNIPGSTWYHVLPVLQSLAVFGIYGLTFMTLLWATLPFLALRKGGGAGERSFLVLAALSFLVAMGWGAVRLLSSPTVLRTEVAVQILQPDVTREEKIEASDDRKALPFARQMDLMRRYPPVPAPVTLSVWPETVFDVSPAVAGKYYARIAELLPAGGYAAFGVHRTVAHKGKRDIYNSLVVIDRAGQVLATHDKTALAPWGEYVPLEAFLQKTPLRKYFSSILRLTAGKGPQTFRIGNLPPFSPVICFESAFSGAVLPEGDRPDFLLFVADDAWSAGSVGPFQHFGFTRLRAIEEGLPALRAANIGVSAVFDPYGRELRRLDMHETGVMNTPLPAAAEPTVFSRFGDRPLLGGVVLLTMILLLVGRRRKTEA